MADLREQSKYKKSLTQEEFLERCYKVWGNRYDYSETIYTRSAEPIDIVCKKHGKFRIGRASQHTVQGVGCPECLKMERKSTKLSQEMFLSKAKETHQDRYDLSQTIYSGYRDSVSVICNKHGVFELEAGNFLRGSGCDLCADESRRLTHEEFIERAKQIHGDTYSYDNCQYITSNHKILVTCKIHGDFKANPQGHLAGYGCRKCHGDKISKQYTKPQEQYIEECKVVHYNKYDYSKVVYTGKKNKIIVICPNHGDFSMVAGNHLNLKQDCPKCKSSFGEIITEELLKDHNVLYRKEVRFDTCKNKSHLPFDFQIFIEDRYFLIEIDGESHRRPVGFNGSSMKKAEEAYQNTIKRDRIKNNWAKENNINLYRVAWYDLKREESFKKNIKEILAKELNGR